MSIGSYDVVSEHEHIRHLVDRLEAWVDKKHTAGPGWVSELAHRLEQLLVDLGSHFQGEETLVFSDIRARLPRLVVNIDRLVEQHRRMEQDFSKVLRQTQSPDAQDPAAAGPLLEQVSRTLRLLSVHEQQEMELILTAYGQDLGEPQD